MHRCCVRFVFVVSASEKTQRAWQDPLVCQQFSSIGMWQGSANHVHSKICWTSAKRCLNKNKCNHFPLQDRETVLRVFSGTVWGRLKIIYGDSNEINDTEVQGEKKIRNLTFLLMFQWVNNNIILRHHEHYPCWLCYRLKMRDTFQSFQRRRNKSAFLMNRHRGVYQPAVGSTLR